MKKGMIEKASVKSITANGLEIELSNGETGIILSHDLQPFDIEPEDLSGEELIEVVSTSKFKDGKQVFCLKRLYEKKKEMQRDARGVILTKYGETIDYNQLLDDHCYSKGYIRNLIASEQDNREKDDIYKFFEPVMNHHLECIVDKKECDYHSDEYLKKFKTILRNVKEKKNNPIHIILFTIWIANKIEAFEEKDYENYHIFVLRMRVLEEAAILCQEWDMITESIIFREYQRDSVNQHPQKEMLQERIAYVDMEIFMSCISSGRTEKAIERGEEAIYIYDSLCEENPDQYIPYLILACSNLGGLFMDLDEYEKAKIYLYKGSIAWQKVPDESKPELKDSFRVLYENIKKYKMNKQEKQNN